jgi:tetratricopeptide (TPR) repeat protein
MEGYDSDERVLLELELLARLDQGNALPGHVAEYIRTPELWARAVAARARGMRARRGPQASLKTVMGAAQLDLNLPGNAPALESLVLDLIELDRADQAFARLDAALKASPDAAAFHAIRGLALLRASGDSEKARHAWDRTLELDEGNATALRGLARLEAESGKSEAALALYARAAAADEQDTEALRESAELLAATGRHEEARAALESLLERDPYAGTDALRLARLMLEEESVRDDPRVLVLLRGAVLFGGGAEAEQLLERQMPSPDGDPARS